MATNPTLITTPFAQSGDKTTPPNTNTPSDGRFSQTLGFPPVTAIPLGSGGKATKREDFNGAFNMLSNIAFFAQKGWVFQWDSAQAYYTGCIVRYSGSLYECTADVTSTTNPASDTTHWSKYKILPGVDYATKSDTGGNYNTRDIVTSSGTYTAPVSGWYKITVKGGGGGGKSGNNDGTTGQGGRGGGEGGTTIAYAQISAGTSVTVVIGAGGSGGTTKGGDGSNGGNSTVTVGGTTYTGGGGLGSISNGGGGTGTIPGASGGQITQSYQGGANGAAGGGNGGGASPGTGSDGNAGTNGGGGSGGSAHATNHWGKGGNGGDGFVWFEYYSA